jgi:hypothetical protein
MARRAQVVRRRGGRFGSTTAAVASFGWSSRESLKSFRPGSCAGGAPNAENGSPITHPFALPRKRFVKRAVLERSKAYLGTDVTYGKAVWGDRVPIQYDPKEGGEMAKGKDPLPALAPSTIWRWLSWLGGLPKTLRAAWELIGQKDRGSTLHREPWAVAPAKYRSTQRQTVLQRAMQLITAGSLLERLFGEEIFPRFAMAQGWS